MGFYGTLFRHGKISVIYVKDKIDKLKLEVTDGKGECCEHLLKVKT